MFPKYSANKKSASFDLKQAFNTNTIIGVVALLFTVFEFIISVLIDFSLRVNEALSDVLNEIPANPLSILGNAEYLEKFRNNTEHVCSMLSSEIDVSFVVILCAAIGAMFSLTFAYSMKKKNVNFYYSIPVDRATMFKNRITTAVMWIAIVFALPILCDMLINIAFFGFSSYLVKIALALFAECFIYSLASFTICTIGIVACYTVIEGIFFAGALYTFPTALMIVLDFICNGFLRGYNRSTVVSDIFALSSSSNYFGEKSFLLVTSLFNPLLLGTKLNAYFYSDNIFALCNNQATFDKKTGEMVKTQTLPDINYIIPILVWVVLIVAGMFLAKYIFTHKKMENASIHGSNRFATGFFALQLSMSIASVFAVTDIARVNKKIDNLIAFGVMLVIIVAVYYITVSIGKRKAFHDVKTYVTPLIAGGALGVVCLVLGTGLFGYANVPSADKIEYATITADGMVDTTYGDAERGMFPFKDYYGENIIGIFSEKEDIEKFVKVAEAVSSSKGKNMENCSITVVYKLKNGKKVSRKFDTADRDAIYSLLSLTDTKEFKENLNNFILKDSDSNMKSLSEKADIFDVGSDVFGYDFWVGYSDKASLSDYDKVEVSAKSKKMFDIKNNEQLRQALAKDFAEMTFEQRFKPTEKEICTLSFIKLYDYEVGDEWDGKPVVAYGDSNEYADSVYYDTEMASMVDSSYSYVIYPFMKNTVDYLNSLEEKQKALIFASDFKFDDLKFVKATVLYPKDYCAFGNYTRVFTGNCNYYDYIIDGGYTRINGVYTKESTEITDKSKMAELFDSGKGSWYVDDDDLLVVLSTDKKNEAEEIQSVALIIPKDDISNWLEAEMKK